MAPTGSEDTVQNTNVDISLSYADADPHPLVGLGKQLH